eukprot:285855-Hanusia_phi.AAC.1
MTHRASTGSDVSLSSAAADAAAAVQAVAAGKPVQAVNDAWVPTFEMRRDSAEALRMVQESCNW